MAKPLTNKKGHRPQHQGGRRSLKRQQQENDFAGLEAKVKAIDLSTPATTFAELPLSKATASGLSDSHFKILTAIQQKGIPVALQGRDVLGAAKTGSGKTLAFLVPVLERLIRKKWTEYDGLGALIMSPTRELAIQIFQVLRKIGRYHTFSAGLVIGGGALQEERERMGKMNILVCTPGRMLQHLDQTASLNADNLQILVLDEADRILDMGFQSTVDALVDHLPKDRQTLLFSATQTKRVSDLARLSLKEPEYISVHEDADMATPDQLQQNYVITPLPEKLDTLWSFLRANTKDKIIVFLSSGKQVRFVYESFRHLQPGIPLMHLHGRQKQTQRLDITHKFTSSKNACLISTDVSARGLDFPAVDWVLQLDCPEDAETYIHRVGRTARFEREGRAVLFLEPSEEEAMLQRLAQKKVPIEKINVKEKKQQSIKTQLQNMCFKDPELKYLGQRAFMSYVKSIYVQKDKEVFDLKKLPLDDFAASLGLPGAPRIKFQKGDDAKERKNAPRAQKLMGIPEDEEGQAKDKPVRTKYDRMFGRQNQDILTPRYAELIRDDNEQVSGGSGSEGEDFLKPKRRLTSVSLSPEPLPATIDHKPQRKVVLDGGKVLVIDSKRREKLLTSKKQLIKYKAKGQKLVFDDEGNARPVYVLEDEEDFRKKGPAAVQRARFVEEEQRKVKTIDIDDKAVARRKKLDRKEKDRQKKRKRAALAAEEKAADVDEAVAVLTGNGKFLDPFASDVEQDDEDDAASIPRAKKRKTQESNKSKRKSRAREDSFEPETLEDLEAMAARYN